MRNLKPIFFLALFYSSSVFGVDSDCPVGEIRVRSFPRSDYVRDDGTYYSAADVTSFCRAKNKTSSFWAGRFDDNQVVGWPNKVESFKRWSKPEIESVLIALEGVPVFLWKNVKLHRASISAEHKDNSATSAEAVAVLYDKVFSNPKLMPRILSHELAHQIFRDFQAIEQAEYRQAAQWIRVGANADGPIFKVNRKRFVEPDGDQSPGEDFANNLEYFIFDPIVLRKKNPQIYDWMSLQYGDKVKDVGG